MPTVVWVKAAKTYRQTAIRLSPRDDKAIQKIIAKGYANSASDAIRVALQRFSEEHAA